MGWNRIATATASAVVALAAVGGGLWLALDDDHRAPSSPRPDDPYSSVVTTRADLRPPRVAVKTAAATTDPRLVLITPRAGPVAQQRPSHQQGPMLLDAAGRVVWFKPLGDTRTATDLQVQTYQGKPVLTWWQGPASTSGSGSGEAVIVDRAYRTIATVQAGNGYGMDLHEFTLTDRGSALITIFHRRRGDLSKLGGGRDAPITEGIVQEVDVKTGKVLFEWHSLDHVAASESVSPRPTGADESYDYFHVNSVAELDDDHLLVSARNTSTIYAIDKRTGKVVWRLGGRKSDFAMGPGTHFALQHDARWLGGGDLQLFDNEDQTRHRTPSSALVLHLDRKTMRATKVRRVPHPDGLAAVSQGSVQQLGDGGLFVGWGATGAVSRFAADGTLTFDARLPTGYDSYRARLQRWTGVPDTRPAVTATGGGGKLRVSVSWNGATRVRAWQLLAGATGTATISGPIPWNGLETTFTAASGTATAIRVRALDANGRTLATSLPVAVG